ncbi:MAG: heme exporter protein CcmD [Alphaproteobacteria bacterium]
MMSYAGFVFGSYAAGFALLIGLCAYCWIARKRSINALKQLEKD